MNNALKEISRDKTKFDGYIVTVSVYKDNIFDRITDYNYQLFPNKQAAQDHIDTSIADDLKRMNAELEEPFYYSNDNKIYSYNDNAMIFEYNIIGIMAEYSQTRKIIDTYEYKDGCYKFVSVIKCVKLRLFRKPKVKEVIKKSVWARSAIEANKMILEWFIDNYNEVYIEPKKYDFIIELPKKVKRR